MSPGNADAPSDLLARAESIAHEFDFKSEDARRLTEHFVQHMKNSLRHDDSPSQIPSYVTKVPTGSEKGVFLAVDLGGTNCRVCSVRLHGDGTYALVQAKHAIPRALTADKSHRPLFDFVAEKIRDFLQAHPEADVDAGDGEGDDGRSHGGPADDENADNDDEDDGEARPNRRRPGRRRRHNDGRPRRQLGFTFSFTYEQLALDRGRVLFWDKGWDLPSAVGKDPCELLQEAIDGLGLPVAVAALANDSVGTLLTRAYTTGGATVTTTATTTTTKEQGASGRPARGDGRRTLIGAIFGTGTNAAYVERARAVTRGRHHRNDAPGPDDVMVINTEWGGFGDGAPALLPTTAYDADLDAAAPHPGRELLEKRVSGLYLGEILRRALACLATEGRLADLALPAASPLFAPAGLDSALLSHVARGGDNDGEAAAHIARALGIEDAAPVVVVGPHHVRAVRCLARAVARRAARLAGAALAAVILQSDEARRAAALETAPPPPPLAVPPSSQAAPTRPRWTTGGAASASASPDGKMASLYRRFRTFVHGLMRSLGLQWAFTPPAPPGAGGGDREDGPGPGDEPKEAAEAGVVEIGVDGSLVEFYPTFEAEMREAIRDVLGPAQERRVRIGLAKDGSGVGAALMALAASMQS